MSKSELLYGIHSVDALLEKQPERFIEVYALKGREDERLNNIIAKLNEWGISVQLMNRKAMDDKSEGEQHQGIIARVKTAKVLNDNDLDSLLESLTAPPFLLILDGVTDPHNLGACLRSADAAGVHAVIIPKDNSASLTPVVRKVACGAAESVPLIHVTNLARAMRSLQDKGVWIYGTAGEATQSLYDCKLEGGMALAMGAEGKGLRRLTREHCDQLIKLPMAGAVSSLNVSVATGVCLFEVVRQRG
ncbi:23S rRNA Gm-2251 2'-O-methyltransferase [Psychromonas ingrahamii 37]|uniref:23S rRNA (guanosine-2'-O-)-methyltransferase RlmB n=1 Tax=Psychromonas ingrahamii (strain DSM 17664 / CCUG 51855 / 37) TaxID=357804 RepID=A1T037_PSYIN|nr:23S rRNA (guanosine(2251)-2'-O)-methyltransferase RlmB [Psychromonas ingrahamii]ABM05102.1 23S rRNA Gm-2251 2'-O-methyltransferase [Psychromonas ingrahamii 37]